MRGELKGLVIVANFNQVVEIGNVLSRLEKNWPQNDCVVVDDGSSDGSREVAKKMGFVTLEHDKNRGIGAAIRTGIRYAQKNGYDFVVISSSNGKIQPEEIKIVAGPVIKGVADYITGSRFMNDGSSPGLPLFRKLAIPMVSIFSSVVLGRRFTDITCGFRAYKLSIFNDPKMNIDQDWLDHYELEYYIHYWACKQDIRIMEVPVNIVYKHLKKGRKSKIKPFVGWWSMLRPFVFLVLGIKK